MLLVERDKKVVSLVFNRPEARNAMSPELRDELLKQLKLLACDEQVAVVVLRGSGGSFVAGGDLRSFAKTLELEPAERQKNFTDRVRISSELVTALVEFPKPLISVVEGDAAGAGISIALCSDFVIANHSARLSFAHAQIGLALDLGLSYFLPRTVGTLQAKRLAMLGTVVDAQSAKELGLVTTLVADEQIEAHVEKLASKLQKMPALAMSAIKTEFREANSNTLLDHLNLEAEMVGQCAASDDFKQRVSAFVAKST